MTCTLTESLTLPPGPVQLSTKVVATFNGALCWEPEVDFAPDQPLLAEQAVAFVEFHIRVTGLPSSTEGDEALRVRAGACG